LSYSRALPGRPGNPHMLAEVAVPLKSRALL